MSDVSLTRAAAKADVKADGPQPATRPLVMVVDDHADTRDMLRYAIEMNGCSVVEACDGEDAVRIAERMLPNLILMDTSLPGIDGYVATERIRKFDSLQKVTIIFLSGHAEQHSREKALAAGGDDYFVKPVPAGELEVALAKYLVTCD